jgi:holo-[acyl-carrier protein] synthase
MIIGMGSDLCDTRRIAETLTRFGDRFVQRCFTPQEQAQAEGRAQRAATYAKRFAAKEACAKALGTGIGQGVLWRDMGVVNLPSGKPGLALTGGAARHLEGLVPPGHRAAIHLSLSDDADMALAFVIIEAVPVCCDGMESRGSNPV